MKNKIRVSVKRQVLFIFTLMLIPVAVCLFGNRADSPNMSTEQIDIVMTTTVATTSAGATTTAATTTTTTAYVSNALTSTETGTTSLTQSMTETTTEATYVEPMVAEETSTCNSEETNMELLGNLRITGYISTGSPTASGDMPYVGGVAINQSFMTDYGLSYGDTVYVDGLGYYTLNDTGCKYGVVDVFCNSVDECYTLTSYADVYLVRRME